MVITIKLKKGFWETLLRFFRIKRYNIKFGEHLHFKPSNSNSNKIVKGSLLYGWHTTKKGETVFGTALVEDIKEDEAEAKLIKYTEF